MKGRLGAADAEIVLPSLDAAAQKLRRQSQSDVNATDGAVPMPNRAQLLSQALVDRCVRSDAMAPGSKPAPSATTVRISADDPNVIHNLDGWYLRPSVANELCCDTIITTVMLDTLGLPLDVGRDQRLATATLTHDATATFTTPDGTVLHTKPNQPKPHPAHAGPSRDRRAA